MLFNIEDNYFNRYATLTKTSNHMKNLFLVFTIFISINTNAGSGPAYLDCESESKRTKISLIVDDISTLNSGILKIDNDSLIISNITNDAIMFVKSDSIFTIIASFKPDGSNICYMEFWALPNTFNHKVNERHSFETNFKAKIQFTDPRPDKNIWTPTITVGCRLEYSI